MVGWAKGDRFVDLIISTRIWLVGSANMDCCHQSTRQNEQRRGAERLSFVEPEILAHLCPAGSGPKHPLTCCGLVGNNPPAHTVELALDGGHSDCLRTLGPLLDTELNSLVFLQRPVAVSLDFRVVDEHICCAAVRSDKTEAFFAVKPFHSSLCHTFNFSHFERMPTGIPGKRTTRGMGKM